VGVLPFPTLPGGAKHPVAGGNALTVLSTDACQKEVAVEFVVSLLHPDVVAASTEALSYIPVDTEARRQLERKYYREHPELTQFNDLVPSLVAPPSWGGARGGEVPQFVSEQVARIIRGEDVTATLASAQARAEDLTR
jgi:multiple sugar transport system substrate-binding protein